VETATQLVELQYLGRKRKVDRKSPEGRDHRKGVVMVGGEKAKKGRGGGRHQPRFQSINSQDRLKHRNGNQGEEGGTNREEEIHGQRRPFDDENNVRKRKMVESCQKRHGRKSS